MKQEAKIQQIQTINGLVDVMDFEGSYCYRNSIAEITLLQNGKEFPYMIIWDLSKTLLQMKFLSNGEVVKVSTHSISSFLYGEEKMELGIRLIRKMVSENGLNIVYELYSKRNLIAQNELKVEVKKDVNGTSVKGNAS